MAVQREYLSPNEIAELLGVSPFTIRRYIKLGELRAVKLLGGFRVHRDDLQRFLKAHEVNPSEEVLETEENPAEPAVPIPTPPPQTEHLHRQTSASARAPARRKTRRTRAAERPSDQK